MNSLSSIGDEEFISFLHDLGVETYNKSFEWMLSDQEFGDVLRWFYKNLDQNNALSAREECRYAEIEKKGNLLSSEDLEATLCSTQQEYSGICIPGDQEAVEDMKLDMMMLKERLGVLEKHERVLNDLLKQNETTKQELDMEIIKLTAAQHQCEEDEAVAAQECLQLARDVDYITTGVVDVVADTLSVYASCCKDKENAKRFLTFGPFDSYRQSQALFRSHFDLYTTKKFEKRSDDVTEDDLRAALIEAKSMEGRLSEALSAYIESKSVLSGEQAKLALVSNYNNVHPSQITSCLMEAQSALELLEQEESILEQQLRSAAQDLVERRTRLAVDSATTSALVVRQQISKDLSFLLDITQQALAVDRLVYCALRHELRSMEELLHFACDLRLYVLEDREAVSSRVQSMNEICLEHDSTERALQSSDSLLNALCSILNVESKDGLLLVKSYNDLVGNIQELKNSVLEGFAGKERMLEEYKAAIQPLTNYVFDGCTKQPNCYDRGLASMAHCLRTEVDRVDKCVLEASGLFLAVKNGDKRNLRKLWQWFLTDPAKLFAAIKNVQTKSYTK
ncbi:augmin complex subunit dgt3 [Epargyreus clarus]|uniref:augmin complex subunit dgt3 n=1 Tax=Epargyreus clarus TaxID=520877 RepID=UPI003C2B97DA